VPGALLITVGLTSLVYAIVEAQGKGWGSTTTIGFGAVAIVLLLVFVVVEQRRAVPLINLAIFRLRTLSTANAAIALIMGANVTFFFVMTLYMQEVLHYSAVETGFAFVPLSVGMMTGSVLAQRLIPIIGIKPQVVLGLGLSAAGFLLYLRTPASSANYAVDLMVPMLISSFGLGNALVPATLLATSNVPEKDSGLASGLLNTFFQVGGALGLAILTTPRCVADVERAGWVRGRRHRAGARRRARGRLPSRLRTRRRVLRGGGGAVGHGHSQAGPRHRG